MIKKAMPILPNLLFENNKKGNPLERWNDVTTYLSEKSDILLATGFNLWNETDIQIQSYRVLNL